MKILTLLAVTFTSACAVASPAEPVLPCPNPVTVQLIVHREDLTLSNNSPICVVVPGEFKIKIHNPPGSGVTVGPGDATAGGKLDNNNPPPTATMAGDNSVDADVLVIKISGTANIGDEFDYWVKVAGVENPLDPTVRVIGNPQRTSLTYGFAAEALDLLGLEPDLIQEILRPIKPEDE